MAKSDYIHQVGVYEGIPYIAIIDQNLGRMSVTNDIENVIAEVCKVEGIKAQDRIIVYCDSEGNWDAFSPSENRFILLNQRTKNDALDAYQKLLSHGRPTV